MRPRYEPASTGLGELTQAWREVREAAAARLQHSGYVALRMVTCEFREGVLTLRGRVPSFYLKQLAHASVVKTPGVEMVVNSIDVREDHD